MVPLTGPHSEPQLPGVPPQVRRTPVTIIVPGARRASTSAPAGAAAPGSESSQPAVTTSASGTPISVPTRSAIPIPTPTAATARVATPIAVPRPAAASALGLRALSAAASTESSSGALAGRSAGASAAASVLGKRRSTAAEANDDDDGLDDRYHANGARRPRKRQEAAGGEERITMASLIYKSKGGIPMPSSEEQRLHKRDAVVRAPQAPRAAIAATPPPLPAALEPPVVNEYAPQVRIVDGKIVLDEGSLTVVPSDQPAVYNAEVIEETGNHVTSSSYTNRAPADRWTAAETEVFYEGLSYFGTDFALISKLFPSRNRRQIKNKYKREERVAPEDLHRAIMNRRTIDSEKMQQLQQRIRSDKAADAAKEQT